MNRRHALYMLLWPLAASSLRLIGQQVPSSPADAVLWSHAPYLLRPGDALEINYRLTPEFNQTVLVQPDGIVTLDVIGDVDVAGRTVKEVQALVLQRASTHLNKPEVYVLLKGFQAPYIVVAGEVFKPGRLDLRERTTALQAIMLAGGPKDSAYESHVYLFRKVNSEEAEVHLMDLHKIDRTQDLSRNLVLEPGDLLFVPRNKLERLSRFVRLLNIGLYVDPTRFLP